MCGVCVCYVCGVCVLYVWCVCVLCVGDKGVGISQGINVDKFQQALENPASSEAIRRHSNMCRMLGLSRGATALLSNGRVSPKHVGCGLREEYMGCGLGRRGTWGVALRGGAHGVWPWEEGHMGCGLGGGAHGGVALGGGAHGVWP